MVICDDLEREGGREGMFARMRLIHFEYGGN